MSYTKPKHCIFCGDPESLCRCPREILEFAIAHVVPTDDGRGVVQGDTLRVLIERAQAWGRAQGEQAMRPEVARNDWIPVSERAPEGDGWVLCAHEVLGIGGVVIRDKSAVRLWVNDPRDKSMMDAYWMELPSPPQGDVKP